MCATLLCTCTCGTETVCPPTQSVENANLTALLCLIDGKKLRVACRSQHHIKDSLTFFLQYAQCHIFVSNKAQSASRVLRNSVHTGYSLLYQVLGEKRYYNEVTTAIHLVTGAAAANYSLDCCWLCRMVGIN